MNDRSPPKRAFVAWDTTTPGLRKTLGFLHDDPPEGWEVEFGGRRKHTRDLWSEIEEPLRSSDRIVALVDLPNANVGYELGFALGSGRDVVLGYGGELLPEWVVGPPLKNFVVAPGADQTTIEELVTTVEPFQVHAHPEPGEDTLVLCPQVGIGDAILRWIKKNTQWRGLPEFCWNLTDLAEQLAGVERVVWIIVPFPEGTDRRDGQNAPFGVIAGYWAALGRELHVWIDDEARDVVDIGREAQPFPSVRRFIELAQALDRPQGSVDSQRDPLEVYLSYVARHHLHLPSLFSCEGRDLPEVHVDLALAASPSLTDRDGADRGLLHNKRRLRELLELTSHDDPRVTRHWTILGEPGAGKTTACRYLCHELASAEDRASTPVPVFAELSELADAKAPHPFTLAEQAVRAVHGDVPAEGVERALHELAQTPGRVWLFLDGLDELDQERRKLVRERLLDLSRVLDGCVIVVTSRPAGFVPIPGFLEARIQRLDGPGQKALLENWLGAGWRDVWNALSDRPTLLSLCTNPMQLSLVAYARATGEADEQFPRSRHELYDRAIDTLLERGHGRTEGVASPFEARRILHTLAVELMKTGEERWSRNALLGLAKDSDISTSLAPWRGAVDRFIDDVGENSGLLAAHEGSAQPWRWLHRSIGEYLAAEGLNELGEQTYRELAQNLEDAPRWGEVFGYLCTFAETEPKKLARLRTLAEASTEIALRALPEIDGVDPAASFDVLKGLGDGNAWDGDHLLALARGWRAEGHDKTKIRKLLWDSLTPAVSLDHVAYVVYALDGIDQGPSIEELRACLAQRPGVGEPPNIRWERCPPSGGEAVMFLMGSPTEDEDSHPDERPQREVELQPFELATTPVTEAQFARLHPQRAGSELPAVNVTWWEAWLFCRWIGSSLPTEAQWEYACRAGTTSRYWSGDSEEDPGACRLVRGQLGTSIAPGR